jgi:molybdopterin synthase catalytic subunit/molybdopterin converting factor small subunit
VRVRVRYFALQREQLGRREESLELSERATVADAWRALVAANPILGGANGYVRFARNGAYAELADTLADADELAIIPPVAGGADMVPERRRATGRLRLTHDPIEDTDVAALARMVASPADGAVVTFVGRTRETPGSPAPGQEDAASRFSGQAVVRLEYEAYESMALAVLDEIGREIEARFGVGGVAMIHRIGTVAVGETSVAIAVAAPHRGEAFDACRYAIEELKARAPIWKSEQFADGSVWLGAPARTSAEVSAQPSPAATARRSERPERSTG